jgi:hypothetical protein
MAGTLTDVLVAGYQDIKTATKDFDSLVALVKERKIQIEGVISLRTPRTAVSLSR